MGMLFFSFLEYRGHYSRQFLDRQSRRLPVRRDWQQQQCRRNTVSNLPECRFPFYRTGGFRTPEYPWLDTPVPPSRPHNPAQPSWPVHADVLAESQRPSADFRLARPGQACVVLKGWKETTMHIEGKRKIIARSLIKITPALASWSNSL